MDGPRNFDALAKSSVVEATRFAPLHPHFSYDLSQKIILLFQCLKDFPNFVEVASQNCLLNSFAARLLDIKRHQHIAEFLASRERRMARPVACTMSTRLRFGLEKRDHVHRWNIHAFGQAAGIRENGSRRRCEFIHETFAVGSRHLTADVRAMKSGQMRCDSSRSSSGERLGGFHFRVKGEDFGDAKVFDGALDCDLVGHLPNLLWFAFDVHDAALAQYISHRLRCHFGNNDPCNQ